MSKIKSWEKSDEYVWKRKSSINSQLYNFIWIASNNVVRISENMPKNSFPLELVKNSYVIGKFKTMKQADMFVKDFMKEHTL